MKPSRHSILTKRIATGRHSVEPSLSPDVGTEGSFSATATRRSSYTHIAPGQSGSEMLHPEWSGDIRPEYQGRPAISQADNRPTPGFLSVPSHSAPANLSSYQENPFAWPQNDPRYGVETSMAAHVGRPQISMTSPSSVHSSQQFQHYGSVPGTINPQLLYPGSPMNYGAFPNYQQAVQGMSMAYDPGTWHRAGNFAPMALSRITNPYSFRNPIIEPYGQAMMNPAQQGRQGANNHGATARAVITIEWPTRAMVDDVMRAVFRHNRRASVQFS